MNSEYNKTLVIIGVIVLGIITTYLGNTELGAAALGALAGYLSHDKNSGTNE